MSWHSESLQLLACVFCHMAVQHFARNFQVRRASPSATENTCVSRAQTHSFCGNITSANRRINLHIEWSFVKQTFSYSRKKKVKSRVWGLFGTVACRPIVPLPQWVSLIHRHTPHRHERPLLAKEGIIQGILLAHCNSRRY